MSNIKVVIEGNKKSSLSSFFGKKTTQPTNYQMMQPTNYQMTQSVNKQSQKSQHDDKIEKNPQNVDEQRNHDRLRVPKTSVVVIKKNEPKFEEKKIVRYHPQNMEKHSLTYFVNELAEKITKHAQEQPDMAYGEESVQCMKNFKIKFSKHFDVWNELVNRMLKTFEEIDHVYKHDAYCGLKPRLESAIIRIMFSYIIIGPEVNYGKGIDNYNGGEILNIDHVQRHNGPSIHKMIVTFFIMLPKQIETICNLRRKIREYEHKKRELEEELDNLDKKIETLGKTIEKQKNDTEKIKDEDVKKLMIENLEKNVKILKMDKKRLNEIKNGLDNSDDIDKLGLNSVDKKITDSNSAIIGSIRSLFDTLKFSYMMHDDWYPQMDYGLYYGLIN